MKHRANKNLKLLILFILACMFRCRGVNPEIPEYTCSPKDRRCNGPAVEVCTDDGIWAQVEKCEEPEECRDGKCIEGNCIPNCEGKECGFDGCKRRCGSCPTGEFCNSRGRCIDISSEGVVIYLDQSEYTKGQEAVITVKNNLSHEIYYRKEIYCGLSFWQLEEYKDNMWREYPYAEICKWGHYPPLVKLDSGAEISEKWPLSTPGSEEKFIGKGMYRLMFNFTKKEVQRDDLFLLYSFCTTPEELEDEECKDVDIIYSNEFVVK
jgi:hypothetical protein